MATRILTHKLIFVHKDKFGNRTKPVEVKYSAKDVEDIKTRKSVADPTKTVLEHWQSTGYLKSITKLRRPIKQEYIDVF